MMAAALPTLLGVGTIVLAGSGLRKRRGHTNPEKNLDVDVSTSSCVSSARIATVQGYGHADDSVACGESSCTRQSTVNSIKEPSSIHLDAGSTICFISTADRKLMGVRSTTGLSEMTLIPVTLASIQADNSKNIQHFPSDSIFVVHRQGQEVAFASVGAGGQLLKAGKDCNLTVNGHKQSKHHTWHIFGKTLVNAATAQPLSLTPQTLHAFSVDEMRVVMRNLHQTERELQQKITELKDVHRKKSADHKESIQQATQEKLEYEGEINQLRAEAQKLSSLQSAAEEESRRKSGLLRQLEARLADISLGAEAGSATGGISDVVRHWQDQVTAAEDRVTMERAEHARELEQLQTAHAAELEAVRQEAEAHTAEALSGTDPNSAALQERVARQQRKLAEQSAVIKELIAETERLAAQEAHLLEEVERLAVSDHTLSNIARSIEVATPRGGTREGSGSIEIRVARNPWQDKETVHERLVRESSMTSTPSLTPPRNRSGTAGDGKATSKPRTRPSSGDRSILHRPISSGISRRLSLAAEGRRVSSATATPREVTAWGGASRRARDGRGKFTFARPQSADNTPREASDTEGHPDAGHKESAAAQQAPSAHSVPTSCTVSPAKGAGAVLQTTGPESQNGSVVGEERALNDATNSPRRTQSLSAGAAPQEVQGEVSEDGTDENAGKGRQGAVAVKKSFGRGGFLGMGQADEELSKSAKEELSVLRHNTQTMKDPRHPARRLSHAGPLLHNDDTKSAADIPAASDRPSAAAPAQLRRSSSFDSSVPGRPQLAQLDLSCIPDLQPEDDGCAVPDAQVEGEGQERNPAGGAGNAGKSALPKVKGKRATKTVVRTPVAERVQRMNKLTEALELHQQASGSDVSLHRTSSMSRSTRPRRSADSLPPARTISAGASSGTASARTGKLGHKASFPDDTEVVMDQAAWSAPLENLQRSVESTGLKQAANAGSEQSKLLTARPPTAPISLIRQPSGGSGGRKSVAMYASTADGAALPASHLPLPPGHGGMPQHFNEADDVSGSVKEIVTHFSSPQKSPDVSLSPEPSMNRRRSGGMRSRHAQRALGVFSASRSFSAGAASVSSSGSGTLRRSNTGASMTGRATGTRQGSRRDSLGDDQYPRRRMSMGERCISQSGALASKNAIQVSQEHVNARDGDIKHALRPSFLERSAVQSIDIKPW